MTCGLPRSLTGVEGEQRAWLREEPAAQTTTNDATTTSEDPVALPQGIRTFLTAKAAPVAAATLVIGGGAAIAAPELTLSGNDGMQTDEVVVEEDEHDWAIGRADGEQLNRIGEFCDENPEAAFCSRDSDDPINWVPGAPSDEEAEESAPESEALVEDEEEDARSETARRVLKELSGDEAVMPGGGPEFGQAVSEQAGDGQLGARVSRAARGDDEEESEVEERRKPGPPDHARGGADSGEQVDAEVKVTSGAEPKTEPKTEPEAEPEAEHRGPTASPGNSGNRGNPGRGK